MKEWKYNKYEGGESSLIKRLLALRGVIKEEEVEEFLNPLGMKLTSYDAFCDMAKAVERLAFAIENDEKILIHGDFDADGVTSTSVLYKMFKHLGANVNYFIPDREKEGHGFDTKALVKLMTQIKPKVVITCDCGISDVDAVNFLNSFRIDVIITDHHDAPEVLPNALAIINPKAPNSLDENLSARQIESLCALAGVGVAYKVSQALLDRFNKLDYAIELLPYVAVGTVADIVPLIGENRFFVARGLQLISSGKHYGLSKLLEDAGYKGDITSEHIAFGVAPRINAAGRLGTVEDALKVLISDNKQEIVMAIQSLAELNKVRQELCSQTFAEATAMLEEQGNNNPAIVLFNPNWHVGIVGIVASQLVEAYHKPAFVMTYSEETKQMRCSARSVEGIDLHEVISLNSEGLDGFGGHAMAAGLSFTTDKISFDEVKSRLNSTIKEMLNGRILKPSLNIDLVVRADEIDLDLIDEISRLEPFGACNPSPVFVIKDFVLKDKMLMGENKNHLRLTCEANSKEFKCIRWKMGDVSLVKGDTLDLAFHPQINEFNGNTSIQLMIDDIHSEHLVEEEVVEGVVKIKTYDHRKKTDILPLVDDFVKNSKQDILILAESKPVIEMLKPFKNLVERVVGVDSLRKCEALMIFDYPSDRSDFDFMLEAVAPKSIHFMNYDIKYFDEKDFLKTTYKMLKFACNNNAGKVELNRISSYWGKSFGVFELLFEIFQEVSLINILEQTEKYFVLELTENLDLGLVLHNAKYLKLLDMIEECEMFQKSLLEDDLESLMNS
ncbi:MAG: single-stranded-DNA-specific exonuclease RecJ [Candidatus Gastranaerophilales bacterium]